MSHATLLRQASQAMHAVALAQKFADQLTPADWLCLNQLSLETSRLVRVIEHDDDLKPELRNEAAIISTLAHHEIKVTAAHL